MNFQVIKAEMIKLHKNTFYSLGSYFSLLIWPILTLTNAYYSFKPFNIKIGNWLGLGNEDQIVAFLCVGFWGYITFFSLVQSAWQMGFERQDGTLEIVFLSPANRLSVIYGRALGALAENIWMFSMFIVSLYIFNPTIPISNLKYIPICLLILLVAAVLWGGLMNVICLFSRDAGILVSIFDEPMILFSGVRVPPNVFPTWANIISLMFPLTHTLFIIRNLLNAMPSIFWENIYYLMINLLFIVIMTIFLLRKAEKHVRKTGTLSFY